MQSFDWFVGLVFVLGWIEDEAPLNTSQTNFNENQTVFYSQFGYCMYSQSCHEVCIFLYQSIYVSLIYIV
jgi:hypothetical protein